MTQALQVTLVFATPTIGSELVMCYGAGTEPLRLRSSVTLAVYQLTAAAVRGVTPLQYNGTNSAVPYSVIWAITNSPLSIAFEGPGAAIGDR